MAIWLKATRSYNNPDSVSYKIAYLREQLANDLARLGDMAYADQVQLAMLGDTIIVGGFLKTELIAAKSIVANHLNVDDLSAITGNFTHLMAGDPFGARLELGEAAGEPFLEAYDDGGDLRVKLLQDRLEFYLGEAMPGGSILSEYAWEEYQYPETITIAHTEETKSDWEKGTLVNIYIYENHPVPPTGDILYIADGYCEGYRISPAIDVSNIENVTESLISWYAVSGSGEHTDVRVYVAITTNKFNPPAHDSEKWVAATDESGIPGAGVGADLSKKYLWCKQVLLSESTEISPMFQSITVFLKGEARGVWKFGLNISAESYLGLHAPEEVNMENAGATIRCTAPDGIYMRGRTMVVDVPAIGLYQSDLHFVDGGGIYFNKTKLIDQGGNDYGSWVRWSNGLQMCLQYIDADFVNSIRSADINWTFPIVYAKVPFVSGSCYAAAAYSIKLGHYGSVSKTEAARMAFGDYSSAVTRTNPAVLFAIGWWK